MSDEKIIVIQQGKLQNIGIIALLLLVVGLIVIGYLGYKRFTEDNERLRNEVVVFKNLTEDLVRSSNKWVTSGQLKDEMKKILTKKDADQIFSDLRRQGAQLESLGETIGELSGKVSELEKSDTTEVIDENKTKYTKYLEDYNKVKIGKASFTTNSPKPWEYEIYKREYHLSTVVGKKENGQFVFYHNLKYLIPKNGKEKYEIKLTSSLFLQQKIQNRFFWLNPKVDVGIFGGWTFYGDNSKPVSFGADLGLSLSSYGYTRVDSLWRLFRFGLGYDAQRTALRISFSPAELNVGRLIPLLSNLYLFPSVGFDTAGGVSATLGIGFQL